MKRITTESGSVYEYDDINKRFRRESIDGDRDLKHADGIWHDAEIVVLRVGAPMYFQYTDPENTGSLLEDGTDLRIRRTTYVVSIEEITPPLLEDLENGSKED